MSSSSGFRGMSFDATCYDDRISEGVELCPFLRNIGVATSFSFSSFKFPTPAPVSFFSSSSSPSRFISSSACCCCKVKPCSHIVDHSSSVSCSCFSFKEIFFPHNLFCSSFLFFFFQIFNPLSFCLFWLQTRAVRGPIFEDGPGFENSFRVFHGRDGVVPLAEKQTSEIQQPQPATEAPTLGFHPLSASAATISLSSFGAFGPFSFDGFMARQKKPGKSNKRKSKKTEPEIEKNTNSDPNVSCSCCCF